MLRIHVVESQQKWMEYAVDERKYLADDKEMEVYDQNVIEYRKTEYREMCRICLEDVGEEPNQIESVYLLPEKITQSFLNVREYLTHPDIPEKLCKKCTTDIQVSYQIMKACESMQVFETSGQKCLICQKNCKSKYHNGIKELTSLILTLRDVPDQETVDAIRGGRYCDSCIESLRTAKSFRYKSYKSEEVLKLQFEECLKVPTDTVSDNEVVMDVEYLDDESSLNIKVEDGEIDESLSEHYAPIADDSEEETDFFSQQLNTPPTQILYKCPQCPATYNHEPDLIMHYDVLHQTKGTLCNECGLTCKNIASLRQHKIRIHYQVYDHVCEICGRQFPGKSKYQSHYVTHFDARNVLCQVCSSAFKTKKSLNLHMRCHTGEKPYSCEVCHKRFSHYSDKKRHTYTHTDERPYNCEICQKGKVKL